MSISMIKLFEKRMRNMNGKDLTIHMSINVTNGNNDMLILVQGRFLQKHFKKIRKKILSQLIF